MLSAQESRQQRWSRDPTWSRHEDVADFSADFVCGFVRDSWTPMFKAPKRRRNIYENLRQKLHTETLCKHATNWREKLSLWKMEKRKKLRQTCAQPQPQFLSGSFCSSLLSGIFAGKIHRNIATSSWKVSFSARLLALVSRKFTSPLVKCLAFKNSF